MGVAWLLSTSVTWGQLLTISFEDDRDDQVGEIDLRKITLTFNPLSGEYEVILEAFEDAGFQGGFLIGINLFNGDLESNALDPSYFHSEHESFDQDCPSPRLKLAGVEPRLKFWSEGDSIAPSGPEPLGLPSGFAIFSSGLASPIDPTQGKDTVGDGVFGRLTMASRFPEFQTTPNAVDDSFQFQEDAATQLLNVLQNDCDPSNAGEALSIVRIENGPTHGTAEIANGFISFTPTPNFFGTDEWQYVIRDSKGNENTASVRITVESVNDLPIAVDDHFEINGREASYSLDVLQNDSTEPEPAEALSILSLESSDFPGSVTVEGNQLTVVTAPSFQTEATFSYTIGDGNGGKATAIVTITSTKANHDPIAIDDRAIGLEDALTIIDVLNNDTTSPDEGETLRIASVSESHTNATLTIVDDKIHYQPPPDFYGIDVFGYRISDSFGGYSRASVRITVRNTNDPPTAVTDFFEIASDGRSVLLEPLANDHSLPDPPEILTLDRIQSTETDVSLSILGNVIRAEADRGFAGTVTFEYWVKDGSGDETMGLGEILVTDANSPPTANPDVMQINPNSEVSTLDVLANDSTAPDQGETLSIISVTDEGVPGSQVTHDGEFVFFTPGEGFEKGWFHYIASDGNHGRDSAIVIVSRNDITDAPTAFDDFFTVLEDQNSTLEITLNDLIASEFLASATLTINEPLNGQAIVTDQLTVQYQPTKDFYGSDSIRYTLTYPDGESSTASIFIEVENTNDRPLAVDDQFAALEDGGTVRLNVLANDSSHPDPEETLSIIPPSFTPNGRILGISNRAIIYQPAPNFSGTDTFSYAVQDEGGEIATASVTVTVRPTNDPPIARPDSISITSDIGSIDVKVLENDTTLPDIEEQLRVFDVTQGESGGTVTVNNTSVTYSPPQNGIEEDQFSYSVSDGNGGVATGSVFVKIEQVGRAPLGQPDQFTINEDSDRTRLDVLENDQSGSPTVAAMRLGSVDNLSGVGRIEIEPTALHFSPPPDFFGTVTLTYLIIEGRFESEPVIVEIEVLPINDPPLARDDSMTLVNPTSFTEIDVLANDTIAVDEGEHLSIESTSAGSANGSILISDNKIHYEPTSSFEGTEQFTYSISDGNGGLASATVQIETIRSDILPPIVKCHNLERALPSTGELLLEASDFDSGSTDDSGDLTLTLHPNRFGIDNVGINQVVLRGIDSEGNMSECHANLTLTLRLTDPLSVEILSPGPDRVYQVIEEYSFSAADIPIEVSVSEEIDTIEIVGDDRLLAVLPIAIGTTTATWVWEEAVWGDHELEIIGIDEETGRKKNVLSRFSVSELASRAALVLPVENTEDAIPIVKEYLFEMGVNVDVFTEPLPRDFLDRNWDLVIWHGLDQEQVSLDSIEIFEEAANQGTGLYFLGTDLHNYETMNADSIRRWNRLTLLTATDSNLTSGQVILTRGGGESLVAGRFGQVNEFILPNVLGGTVTNPEGVTLAEVNGREIAVSVEAPWGEQSPVGRRFTQTFPVNAAENLIPLKSLFQNVACWLLEDCVDCRNANLPATVPQKPSHVILGQVFPLEVLLENNGACEVTGAKVHLSGEGVEMVQLLLDGREVTATFDSERNRWTANAGRIGKGSLAIRSAKLFLKVTNPKLKNLQLETVSNTTAQIAIQIPIDVASFTILTTPEGGLTLQITAQEGQRFQVDFTDDLSLVSGGGFRDVFRRLRIGSKISWFSSLRNRIPLDVSS